LRFVGDVAGDAERPAADALDILRAIVGVGGRRIDADDRGTLGCKRFGEAAADVGAGARDEGDFVFEFHPISHNVDARYINDTTSTTMGGTNDDGRDGHPYAH